MPEPDSNAILYPVFAMVVLVAFVFTRLRSLRFAAVRNEQVSVRFYRAFEAAADDSEPEALRVVSRHFINLFEVPVLFYVGAIMIYVTHQQTPFLVVCAWLYVALRYAYSYVHLTSNDVVVRFSIYLASGVVLALMWASLFIRLVRAG